jgi:hypothetical protein
VQEVGRWRRWGRCRRWGRRQSYNYGASAA